MNLNGEKEEENKGDSFHENIGLTINLFPKIGNRDKGSDNG